MGHGFLRWSVFIDILQRRVDEPTLHLSNTLEKCHSADVNPTDSHGAEGDSDRCRQAEFLSGFSHMLTGGGAASLFLIPLTSLKEKMAAQIHCILTSHVITILVDDLFCFSVPAAHSGGGVH